jgi:glyoxylase-like metal-dependent hydrolase (beta-lactamase superfamily II)
VSELRIDRVLAPNPGPFTLTGTNTWIVSVGTEAIVIDPGPRLADHEAAIVRGLGERIPSAILVTHNHEDHAPLANPLAGEFDVPAYGHAPGPDFEPDLTLVEGDRLPLEERELVVLATPGHSDDHLCFQIDQLLFSGDHIMGGSSVMVEDLLRYLGSLRRLRPLRLERIYPGHGPEIDNPDEVIDWYVAHRLQREQEILTAMEAGARTVPEIVEIVYREVDPSLHSLAAVSVAAHLRKLEEAGPG